MYFLLTHTHPLAGTGSPAPPFPMLSLKRHQRGCKEGEQRHGGCGHKDFIVPLHHSLHIRPFRPTIQPPQYTVSHSGLWRESLIIPQRNNIQGFSHTHTFNTNSEYTHPAIRVCVQVHVIISAKAAACINKHTGQRFSPAINDSNQIALAVIDNP